MLTKFLRSAMFYYGGMLRATEKIRDVRRFLSEEVWTKDPASLKRHEAYLASAWRLVYSTVGAYRDFQIQLRTMSLVYTTLLSMVPLLAVSFSVLRAFGVHDQAEPLLLNFVKPLGPQGAVIVRNIIGYIDRIKIGVLSSVGLSLLFYSMIGVLYKIEEALNYIWRVKKPRSFSRRFSDYLSVLLVGPILMFSAMGLTAAIQSNAIVQRIASIGALGQAYIFIGHLLPYVTTCVAFTIIYILMPNTKVKFKSALAGGIFAGVVWEVTGWAFATFIASSKSYSAVYAGFAILLLFMMWLYWSWLIFLIGGYVSFFYQYPRFAGKRGVPTGAMGGNARERLAIIVMYLIGYNFSFNRPPWTLDTLSECLGLPSDIVLEAVSALEGDKLIYETAGNGAGYLPGRDTGSITVKEIVAKARATGDISFKLRNREEIPEVDRLFRRIEENMSDTLDGWTLKDLILPRQEDEKAK